MLSCPDPYCLTLRALLKSISDAASGLRLAPPKPAPTTDCFKRGRSV